MSHVHLDYSFLIFVHLGYVESTDRTSELQASSSRKDQLGYMNLTFIRHKSNFFVSGSRNALRPPQVRLDFAPVADSSIKNASEREEADKTDYSFSGC